MSELEIISILLYILSIGITIQICLEVSRNKEPSNNIYKRFFFLLILPLIPIVNLVVASYFVFKGDRD